MDISKIDLPSFVQHRYLVKNIVNALRSLVNSNNCSRTSEIRRESKSLDEFQSSGTVQSTSTVIPALQWASTKSSVRCQQCFSDTGCPCLRFCNTDTLPLSTAYSTNEIISDLGIKCVIKAEHGHYNVAHMSCILFSCHTRDSVPGSWKSILVNNIH